MLPSTRPSASAHRASRGARLRFALSAVRRYLPGFRRALVHYDGGRCRIAADLRTALGLHLFRTRGSLPDASIDLVGAVLRPGDTFVDGGAHVGLFTLVAATRVGPRGAVLAFEPARWARRALLRNLALNGFDWVRVYDAALSDMTGVQAFASFVGDAAALSSFVPASTRGARWERVPTVRLDDMLTDAELARLRLVKLDLEGAELRALRGAARILDSPGPDFLVELEPPHLGRAGASVESVLELFHEHGYKPYVPVPRGPEHVALSPFPTGWLPGVRPNVFLTRGCRGLLHPPAEAARTAGPASPPAAVRAVRE